MADYKLTQTGAQVQSILNKANKMPETVGTNGQVLTSNGTNLSWKNPISYTGGLGINIDNDGVISLNEIGLEDIGCVMRADNFDDYFSQADKAGLMAVLTGQSSQPYEIALGDYKTSMSFALLSSSPYVLGLGDNIGLIFSSMGFQYICAHSSGGNVSGIIGTDLQFVPFVVIADPINNKLTAYPWDKFFGSSGSAGTGDVSLFDVSVRLDIPESTDYVKVTTRYIANEDDFLASFNDSLTSLGAPTMTTIDDFDTVVQTIYDASYATDPTQITGLMCFLATSVESLGFINAYYEYQDANSAEPEVHQLIKTNYIGHAKFINGAGTTVDLQTDLATRVANGCTINSQWTNIVKTTIMQGGGAGGSTELKMPSKKIVISSSDETDSGNQYVDNARMCFILTKEALSEVLTELSGIAGTSITEEALPTVWSSLDNLDRATYAGLLQGFVSTNPLCSMFILANTTGGMSDVPFSVYNQVSDVGEGTGAEYDLSEGGVLKAVFFKTETSGDTLTIENVEFDLGVKVAASSGGGETVETEIKPEIYEITTEGGFSAPLHFYLTNGNYEYLKTIGQSQGFTINSIDDMVTAFNNGDAQIRASSLFALGIVKMCADYDGMVLTSVEVASETTEQHNAGDVTITFMRLNGTAATQVCSSSELLDIVMSVSYVHQTIQAGSGSGTGTATAKLRKISVPIGENTDNKALVIYLQQSTLDDGFENASQEAGVDVNESNINTYFSQMTQLQKAHLLIRLLLVCKGDPLFNVYLVHTSTNLYQKIVDFGIFDGLDGDELNGSLAVSYSNSSGIYGSMVTAYLGVTASGNETYEIGSGITITDEPLDLGITVSGGGSGGSGKMYAIDFDLSTYEPSDSNNPHNEVSSSKHYQMCFYESNIERIKDLFANTQFSGVQSVQDLVNAMNSSWDGTGTKNTCYTYGLLFMTLISMADNFCLSHVPYMPAMFKVVSAKEGDTYPRGGIGLSPDDITTVLSKYEDNASEPLEETYFVCLDVNNSATVTEYGTSASSGTSSSSSSQASEFVPKVLIVRTSANSNNTADNLILAMDIRTQFELDAFISAVNNALESSGLSVTESTFNDVIASVLSQADATTNAGFMLQVFLGAKQMGWQVRQMDAIDTDDTTWFKAIDCMITVSTNPSNPKLWIGFMDLSNGGFTSTSLLTHTLTGVTLADRTI